MAAGLFKFTPRAIDSELILLVGSVLFGSGVITSQDSNFFTITRTGTGLYKCSLRGPFNKLFSFNGTILAASVAGTSFEVISVANINSGTDPSFTFRAVNTAGAEADVANGNSALFEMVLRNSAAKRKGA